jgi:sulfur transfer complex TusBCD TusB component (DsrH family)
LRDEYGLDQAAFGPARHLADASLAADDIAERDTHVLVQNLGVAARLTSSVVRLTHRRNVAHDIDARGVGRDDDHREGLIRRRVFVEVGLDHDDQNVGNRGVRREPLVAIDDPLVTVAHRLRCEQRWISTSPRFSH